MIVEMARLRMIGPRSELTPVLHRLQDLGVVHLARVASLGLLGPPPLTARSWRYRRNLNRILDDLATATAALGLPATAGRPVGPDLVSRLPGWARLARRARREAERRTERIRSLEEERALLAKYKEAFAAFGPLLRAEAGHAGVRAYYAVVQRSQAETVPRLRDLIGQVIGEAFELRTRPLASGDTALLLLAPASVAPRVERLLGESGVAEMPVPRGYEGTSLAEALPRMMDRLEQLPAEAAALGRELNQLAAQHGPELGTARGAVHDELSRLEAMELAGVTPHAFVLEGWVPSRLVDRLMRELAVLSPDIAVNRIARTLWADEAVPVVLHNPRLFRPFELLIGLLPLPRYGSIDPTPFVAVFFPMFFGLMLGDVGYGLVLGGLALLLRRRSSPGSTWRAVSEIAGACALFATLFGALFGELFGDLGHRWLGLRPVLLDREHEMQAFLWLVVALGAVHIVLGLVLGVIGAFRRHRREALGPGLSLVMVLLVIVALLAAFDRLPHGLLTPAVIALLVAFPVLVAVEGLVAPVELLSTLGNMLSYARIMALGTASVMLAVVANQLGGTLGSVIVGVVFGLLFHLVNFALGLFSPTIHSLRLHYVEFFGRFYSPGGVEYRPFTHWSPPAERRA